MQPIEGALLDHRPRPPARRRGAAEEKKIGAARSAKAQALGRRRGGLSTKIIATVADEGTALAVDIVPGQAHDAPLLIPMLDRTLARVPAVDEVVGDKGFDGDALRSQCLARDVNPNIPIKANRPQDRWARGGDGYKERNRVERLFAKAKQFRRVATRYDKLKITYLGVLHLTLGFIRLRSRKSVNTA